MKELPDAYAMHRLQTGDWVRINQNPAELCTVWQRTPMKPSVFTQRNGLTQLNGQQLAAVLVVAQSLIPKSHEAFLRAVDVKLAQCRVIGDGAINRIVRGVLVDLKLRHKVEP